MKRLVTILIIYIFCATSAQAGMTMPRDRKDLYFGEALYHAYQGEWFDAITKLDTEIALHYHVDEPEKDTLHYEINEAKFDVGDFELYYRMHQRAGRAIKAVIEGNVEESVRNEAIYRLARIYFQKDQPENAERTVERITGAVPDKVRPELSFLRANIDMALGKNAEAARILHDLQGEKSMEGFSSYNLGIALIKGGKDMEGRRSLDRAGQLNSNDAATLAIKDKANLVLGEKLMAEHDFDSAKEVLDRVRLTGPFSNRALLGSGWADASLERFRGALVPWTILSEGRVSDPAVEEAILALPYAYGKLGVYSNAAVLYGKALETYGREIDKLGASLTSIREGKFLAALVREDIKQDPNWVVRLRELPETPETFYLLDLMASHDFQESLKNYLDLDELRKKLDIWADDLVAFNDIIGKRKAYYQPLLPEIDKEFRRLDSKMRLRLEQRDRIERRLKAMLTAPHPEYLQTKDERIIGEQIALLERKLKAGGKSVPKDSDARIKRLRGLLRFNITTEYDRRFTEAHKHLLDLNNEIDRLKKAYTSFVRTRQAATQSYEGYDERIRTMRSRITATREKVGELMRNQGNMLEAMAEHELVSRRTRLTEYQTKARFSMADSYERATRADTHEQVSK
jgi:tetratricopeptide (TPR) repeat protein